MHQFLTSTDPDAGSSFHIKRILSGKEVRIASAFIGKNADTEVSADARLICDIGMGGTSPIALRILSEKLKDNLRYLQNFHAKIYLSDQGCVVGSANLSNNGVGFLSQATLIEAAILIDVNDATATAAAGWFEELWTKARVVGESEIKWAERAWYAKGGTPEGERNYRTLLEALQDQTPGAVARRWRYIVTREEMPEEASKWADAQKLEIVSEADLQLTSDLDYFYDLSKTEKFYKQVAKNYISLHRNEEGNLELNALRFLRNKEFPEDGKPITISFFQKLDWRTTRMPQLSRADKRNSGKLSAAIVGMKEGIFGAPISAKKFCSILSKK